MAAAIQEDVDVIGISSHSGFHLPAFTAVLELLKKHGATNILVTGGGVIPKEDIQRLTENGVGRFFTHHTPITEIISYIIQEVKHRRKART